MQHERSADAGTGLPCGRKEIPRDLAQEQLPQEPKTGLRGPRSLQGSQEVGLLDGGVLVSA